MRVDLTYKEFAAAARLSTPAEPPPVSVQWLQYVNAVRRVMDDFAEASGRTDSQARMIFAEYYVGEFLGDGWLEEHFSAYKGSSSSENVLFKYRLWRLGRLLFDLQSYDWFQIVVDNVRGRDLAGALFEAEVARLVMQLPIKTTVRTPVGRKGIDYDLDVGGGGLSVAVEVKAKDESTPYSANSVHATFRDARQQLPADGIGLVFMRIPLSWTEDASYVSEIDDLVSGLLRNTRRVQALILVWDELASTTVTTMRYEPRQRVFAGPKVSEEVSQLLTFWEQVWASDIDAFGPASAI